MQNLKIKFAYKPGFRRLWFFLSLLWMTGCAVVVYDYREGAFVAFLVGGVLPCIFVYLLGAFMAWVLEGFAIVDSRG